jgi:hypothetical protein
MKFAYAASFLLPSAIRLTTHDRHIGKRPRAGRAMP